MKKLKISKYFLFISFATCLTILFFIAYQSYLKLIIPSQQLKTSSLLKPINPRFDPQSFLDLQKKIEYTADQLTPLPPLPTISPSAQ